MAGATGMSYRPSFSRPGFLGMYLHSVVRTRELRAASTNGPNGYEASGKQTL
jgi:hypothetical protein